MKTYLIDSFLHLKNLNVYVGYYEHRPPELPGAHFHSFYELVLVREGRALHNMNGEDVKIRAGDVFLIPPEKVHFYHDTEFLGIYNILFSGDMLKYFEDDLAHSANYQMLFKLQPTLSERMRAETEVLSLTGAAFSDSIGNCEKMIKLEHENTLLGNRTEVLGRFLLLVSMLVKNLQPSGQSGTENYVYRISRLIAELDNHPEQEWSLESMAEFIRMTPQNFRLQFRKIAGDSPVNYLLRLRLKKAAELLRLPGTRISEAAFDTGFRDSNYFTRQFHALYGLSPREFRKQCESGFPKQSESVFLREKEDLMHSRIF